LFKLQIFFKNIGKNLFYFMLLLAMLLGGIACWAHYVALVKPLPLLTTPVVYTVSKGQTMVKIARDLVEKNHMPPTTAIVWVINARITRQAAKIKAGEYALVAPLSANQLLEKFIQGQAIEYRLTLVEGWNFHQVLTALAQHPKIKHTLIGLSHADIMQRLGQRDLHPEGQFYPDTYAFHAGFADVAFLRRAFKKMQQELDKAWEKRQTQLPLTDKYQALIMASIIEKETGAPVERPLISAVFNRRLQQHMRLQTDPTVIYGLGLDFDGNLTSEHLQQPNAYNTYLNFGLPPTPIAMPSKAALLAAVQPVAENYLYFVAKGQGLHHFSTTRKQHECAVIRFQLTKGSSRFYQQCRLWPDCDVCQ
jgi:UPF0755 protein